MRNEDLSQLVDRAKEGDQEAFNELFRYYAEKVCRLADRQIAHKLWRRFDADDVVQSTFRTFFRRIGRGEYRIEDSGALWGLLAQITVNKVRRHAARNRAAKRDVRAENPADANSSELEWLTREPGPEEATMLLDELNAVLENLEDSHAQIIQLCLQGHSSEEITQLVGCSRWTVRRVRDRVGKELQENLDRSD